MLEVLHLVFVVAVGSSAALLSYVTLSTLVSLGHWVIIRRTPLWLRTWRGQMRQVQTRSSRRPIAWPQWLALAGASALALKALSTGGVVVGLFLFLTGGGLYYLLGRHSQAASRHVITNAVGEFVTAFYSAFLISPTVFTAMQEAVRAIENSRQPGSREIYLAAQQAIAAFNAGQLTDQALKQMIQRVRDPYLNQFAFIVRHAVAGNQQEILAALRDLSTRLEQRQRLYDRSKVSLALVSGTVRFLQAANAIVISLAVLAPFWWDYYSAYLSRQTLLVLVITAALGGSWYFEQQVEQLRQRVI